MTDWTPPANCAASCAGPPPACGCGWRAPRLLWERVWPAGWPALARRSASLRSWRCSICCRRCRAGCMPPCWRCSALALPRRLPGVCAADRACRAGPIRSRRAAASSRRAGSRTGRCRRSPIGRAARSTAPRRRCGRRIGGAWRPQSAGCASAGRSPGWPGTIPGACARCWRSCCCSAVSTPAPIGASARCGH